MRAFPRSRHDPRLWLLAGLALCAMLLLPNAARAQAWPNKPITLVLPFPPGGSFDPIFRALGNAVAKDLGQPVVLLHKPGAGGVTGTAGLATMGDADGYTIAVMHNSVIRQPLIAKTSWDPLKDFTYIIGLASLSTGIAVAADSPWKSMADLLAEAKKRPGEVSWGNVGAISVNRIMAERLAKSAGVKFNLIPFKGGSEAFTALIGGHLDVYGDPGFGAMATSGKVRLLATMTETRLQRWPNVPTLKELGHDFVVQSNIGLVAPRNLPQPILERLHGAFRKATEDADYKRVANDFDLAPALLDPAGYKAYATAQFQREKAMLDEIGFKPE
ncbi:Bug family tripartite tricarboxylate transporter substrate binding protein [Aquabacterium humicola]|uniref:Bug family tripartite tricarboxylate transporter substrate binding protein n=1 Tax=Aquabacterium humicola TaxID=3237377 RepID=UPI002543135F|nr:tripartite tricarboxylate transporter substrate binding protein [Rubrivivax pictus]